MKNNADPQLNRKTGSSVSCCPARAPGSEGEQWVPPLHSSLWTALGTLIFLLISDCGIGVELFFNSAAAGLHRGWISHGLWRLS